jgi:2-polyprenyl-3-methyl-5-hydroxy-6-metoxy-1,4-benzoquinol methylase
MHALGWTVTGLDVAPAAVERTRGFGLAAQLGTLPSLEWSESCFEAITFWQSLEHTHQPLEVLSNAFRLLSTGGKLFVTVPNFDSFGARWFGAAWYGLDVPRHLIHFTPNTLRLMLMLAGFRDIAIVQQQHNSWIRHSARRHGRSIFATRFASSIAGAWARWRGRAEGILAMAVK